MSLEVGVRGIAVNASMLCGYIPWAQEKMSIDGERIDR